MIKRNINLISCELLTLYANSSHLNIGDGEELSEGDESWRLPASAALPIYIHASMSDGCVRGE